MIPDPPRSVFHTSMRKNEWRKTMKKIYALALAAMLAVSMTAFADSTKSCDPKACEKPKACDKKTKECEAKCAEECKDAKCAKHCKTE